MDSEKNIQEASKKIKGEIVRKIYLSFMAYRFPAHSHCTVLSYALEWVDRFNSGEHEIYMDSESLKDYEKAKGE